MIKTRPCKFKRLGAKPKELTLPEPEQFDAIVKKIETSGAGQARHCADFVRFLAFSGCRISEAGQVLWQDVDFERGEIRVHNAKRSNTSNEARTRIIPLVPAMRQISWRRCTVNASQSRRTPFAASLCCKKPLTRACKRVGCAPRHIIRLRHLFATRALKLALIFHRFRVGLDTLTAARWR